MSTPFASILNEADKIRKDLLRKIEAITNTRIISYIANSNASPNFIDHNDATIFNDILESVGQTDKLDLIIDSPGGEANIAEQLGNMCRSFCKQFRVIVPNRAKSAATMIALVSDEILMGYLSELGPIDPQIPVVNPRGQLTFIPAQSIIDSVSLLHSLMQQGLDVRAAIALIQKIDPPILDVANKALELSKAIAEEWLGTYMFKSDTTGKAKEISAQLCDNRKWLSHGRRIDYNKAKELQLKVTLIDRDGDLWKKLWEYYGRVVTYLNATASIKLFESSSVSLNLGIPKPMG